MKLLELLHPSSPKSAGGVPHEHRRAQEERTRWARATAELACAETGKIAVLAKIDGVDRTSTDHGDRTEYERKVEGALRKPINSCSHTDEDLRMIREDTDPYAQEYRQWSRFILWALRGLPKPKKSPDPKKPATAGRPNIDNGPQELSDEEIDRILAGDVRLRSEGP